LIEKLFAFVNSTNEKGLKWSLHLFFWMIMAFFTFFIFSVNLLNSPESYQFMYGTFGLTLTCFYFLRYSFKHIKSTVLVLFSGVAVLALFQLYTYYSITFLSVNTKDMFLSSVKRDIGDLRYWEVFFNSRIFYYSYTLTFFHLFPPLGIWIFYALLKNFYQTQKLKQENLKLEIAYLHAQINPHFLLNTLTAIYSMVMDKPKAAKSIETLSGLLYYSLYDTGNEKVLLEKELEFIKNYVKLARIRLNRNKKLKLSITGSPKGLTIAPLILVNLIENCIKHGLHRTSGAAEAQVTIVIENGTIHLTTYNIKSTSLITTTGGIGLVNTHRRLAIYYPEKHSLLINDENDIFQVNLNIDLLQ
jgi:two-component system LytT family sensor kinase